MIVLSNQRLKASVRTGTEAANEVMLRSGRAASAGF